MIFILYKNEGLTESVKNLCYVGCVEYLSQSEPDLNLILVV